MDTITGNILKEYVVVIDYDLNIEIWTTEKYNLYVKKALSVGAAPAVRIITTFNRADNYLLESVDKDKEAKPEGEDLEIEYNPSGGLYDTDKPKYELCPACKGEGSVEKNIQRDGYPERDVPVVCDECKGTGLFEPVSEAGEKDKEIAEGRKEIERLKGLVNDAVELLDDVYHEREPTLEIGRKINSFKIQNNL